MKIVHLTMQHMERIEIMSKSVCPTWTILQEKLMCDIPFIKVYCEQGKAVLHWMEFCLGWLLPKMKFDTHIQKKIIQNIQSNYLEEANCIHPVDHLYELFLKGG